MSGVAMSGFLALFGGLVAIVVGFVPYVAWSYRHRGTVGLGRAVLAGSAAIYAFALWTYTILPLPDPATVCRPAVTAQLYPLQFVRDAAAAVQHGAPVRAIFSQVMLNVLLFVPLGMFLRHLFRRGFAATVANGLGVSLLIELTQLTGDWGIYPCAYRLFDVDDLLANTAGAAAGFAAGPVLRLMPGQRTRDVRRASAVTGWRRVLGMAVDVVLVEVVSLALWLPLGSVLVASEAMSRTQVAESWIPTGLHLATAVVLIVLVPLFGRGATVGQRVVLLRPQTDAGSPPSAGRKLVRAVTGSGGYFLLADLGGLTHSSLGTAALLFGVASIVVALRGDHRGLSGIVAGLRVVDAREPWRASSAAERWAAMPELRSLSTAVIVVGALLHLGFLGLLGLLQASGGFQPVAAVVTVGIVGLAGGGSVLFLLLNGAAMVRREGRSLGNLLTLLVGVGFCGLTGLTVAALFGHWPLLTVAVGVGWALVAYLTFLFWAFALFGLFYAHRSPSPGADAVIVLGSRVFGTRVPPLLASRLDRGREVLEAQLQQGGDAVLVCSGGQGPGEDLPEAAAMGDYLVEAGVATDRIRREAVSRTTEQNLLLSLELLHTEGRGQRVIAVTNDFHAFRAAIITRELGLTAQVVGSPTAHYFLPSALLREFVGVLARRPWPHLLVAAAIIGLGVLVAL